MSTVVFFHAHPDDEAIVSAGTMAGLATEGHRVVLVTATAGELGEYPEGFLRPGETLAERRRDELDAACRILGVARSELLGFGDSGMAGEPTNTAPGCFATADVDEAAGRLVAILEREAADVLVTYDEHGNYGHPDHVMVHQVGMRAADLAGTARVYMVTQNRDFLRSLLSMADDFGMTVDPERLASLDTLGEPEWRITTRIDVSDHLAEKRAAMEAHASQIGETSFFLDMPPEAFGLVWGAEWYIRVRGEPGPLSDDDGRETSLVG